MNRKTKRFFALIAVLVLAGVAYEVRQVAALRGELRLLEQETKQRDDRVALARSERDDAERRRQEAETDLATVQQKTTAETPENSARQREIESWSQQVKKLKELFEQQPAQQIPELRLLTESDWLRAAKTVELDSDENVRKAMASVRNHAKEAFMVQLTKVVSKFRQETKEELPSSPLLLAPFFDPPGADTAMLQRYEIVTVNQGTPGRAYLVIREKAAIDEDYDARYSVQATGGWGSSSGPLVWMEGGREMMQRAFQEFVRVNGTEPKSMAQVIPFINPPLAPAQAEKLLKADRDRQR